MIVEDALIRATAEYIRKARIDVEGYTQRRHGKPVHVRDYTRSMIKKLSTDDLARLLAHPEATTEMKMAAIKEYTRRSGAEKPRSPLAQQPKIGPPKRLRGRTSGGPKMTAARRRSLPAEQFGLPNERKYPLDTPGRARNSKVRAKQQLDKGNITQEQYDQIIRRADMALPPERTVHRRRRRKRGKSATVPSVERKRTQSYDRYKPWKESDGTYSIRDLDRGGKMVSTGNTEAEAIAETERRNVVARATPGPTKIEHKYDYGQWVVTDKKILDIPKGTRLMVEGQLGDRNEFLQVARPDKENQEVPGDWEDYSIGTEDVHLDSNQSRPAPEPWEDQHVGGVPDPHREIEPGPKNVSKPSGLPPLSSGHSISVGYLKPGMELLDVPKKGTNQVVKKVSKNPDGSITVLCKSGYTFKVGGSQDPGESWYVRVGNIPEDY